MDPFVSVVVPTYNRGGAPIATLDLLAGQRWPRLEVIVVDQSGEPLRAAAEWARARSPKARYFHIPRPGLPGARNFALGRVAGDVVLFCDDDVVPSPDLAGAHARAYADERVGAVGGRILERGVDPGTDPPDVGRLRMPFGLGTENFFARTRREVEHVQGCNMSFRTRALKEAGGFDERYGGTAHLEDMDACFALRRRGWKVLFEPEAELVHRKAAGGGCRPENLRRLAYWYAHNFSLFYRKHLPAAHFLPFYGARVARAALFGLEAGDPRAAAAGLLGLLDGWAAAGNRPPKAPPQEPDLEV